MPRYFGAGRLIDETLSLLFSPRCPVCRASVNRSTLCASCAIRYPLPDLLCDRCGYPTPVAIRKCGRCREKKRWALGRARSLWWLDPVAQELIHRIKYRGRLEWLAALESEFKKQFIWPFESGGILVPVPLHLRRWLDRGFNQSERIAHWLQRPVEIDGLEKIHATASQSFLGVRSRQKNLKDAFVWRKKVKAPAHVVLIDDIYTSGATLEACAQVLRRAGAVRVDAITLFRTPRFLG